jgi:hypothetical protein
MQREVQSSACHQGFIASDYYDFYQVLYTADIVDPDEVYWQVVDEGDLDTVPDQETTHSGWAADLLAYGKVCGSEKRNLGWDMSLAECTLACAVDRNCFFFIHDQADGECSQESTASADCPEGLLPDARYSFYQVVSADAVSSPGFEDPWTNGQFEILAMGAQKTC